MRFSPMSGTASAIVAIATIFRNEGRQRLRHRVTLRQMMIGDDQIDAASRRCFGCRKGADAGIDADDQPDAALGSLLDHLIAHAIAFADSVRHVIFHLAAAQLQRRLLTGEC